MIYIIMCGGQYREWETPRQLLEFKGEPIVARTIRLLRENGATAIFISSHHPEFEKFGVPVLRHDNFYYEWRNWHADGHWCNCFYPTDEPTTYLFGDVVFSPEAIKTIVETDTDDIELFGSAEPFAPNYIKEWVEPFAFKVKDTEHFHEAIWELKDKANQCWRMPIAWELWCVIKGRRIDIDDYRKDYTIINDYTCDIDHIEDLEKIKKVT